MERHGLHGLAGAVLVERAPRVGQQDLRLSHAPSLDGLGAAETVGQGVELSGSAERRAAIDGDARQRPPAHVARLGGDLANQRGAGEAVQALALQALAALEPA